MTSTTATVQGAGPGPAYEVPRKAWAARRVGAVLLAGLQEQARGVRATTADQVPRSPDEITTEWLTAILCSRTPGARIESVSVPGGSVGTTTRKALVVSYNDAGRAAGLPERLFVKCTTALTQRLVLGLGGFIHGESGFFNQVRPQIEIEAPRGYFAAVDPRSWRSVTVMEDVAATKGATFWSTTTKIDRGRIEDLLANMAVWHGAFWDSPRLRPLTWLKSPADHIRTIDGLIGMEKQSLRGAKRAIEVIPTRLHKRLDDLYQGMARSVEISSRAPHTYLHGDIHVGNTYITRDGAMGYGDWQIGIRGGWQYDYAYIVGTALEVEDRRAWEHELLDYYLDRLNEAGGPRLDRDAAWQAVREATFYPYYAWAYTIGRARYQPKYQPDEISLPMIQRTAAQIDDLDSLKAVGL